MKIEIKALGEKIIKDLNLIDDYDVLNKWMIHYIAEQMYNYDTARTEEEKLIAGEHCSNTIMKFWKNRSHNTSWHPFSNYEELYAGLYELYKDKTSLGFLDDLIPTTDGSNLSGCFKTIKKATRCLVEYMIDDCYSRKYADCDEDWINLMSKSEDGADARILRTITENMEHGDIIEGVLDDQIYHIEVTISMYKKLLEYKKKLLIEIRSGDATSANK